MATPQRPVEREEADPPSHGAGPSRRPRRTLRARRAEIAGQLAVQHGGVMHRRDLGSHGITCNDVRAEVGAGRWSAWGRHTVAVGTESSVHVSVPRSSHLRPQDGVTLPRHAAAAS